MNDRSPFENYLTGRAADIDVPGAGAAAIADRARARRRRRRGGAGAVLGVAVLLGGAVVGQGLRSDDDAQEEVASYGAGIVDSALDWTAVPASHGLGWTYGLVQADSGALYGLSTAPGPGDGSSYARSLYRSDDGTDWAEVALPGGLRANAVAADGETIFAVGTAAAGGGVGVQVASSATPGSDWSVTDLPLDLAAEADATGLPGRYFVTDTAVAVHDGRTVVAVNLGVDVDAARVLPGEPAPDTWYATERGMEQSNPACESVEDPSILGPASPSSAAPTTTVLDGVPSGDDPEAAKAGALAADGTADAACQRDGGEQTIVRTWAELGYPDEVGSLIGGRNHVFVSDDTGGFQPATVVDRLQASAPSVLAGPDGFWLLTPNYREHETITALHSPDGLDWSAAPVEVPGYVVAAGTLGGRPAVLANDWNSRSLVLHTLVPGSVESVDLTEMAGTGSGDRYPTAAGIGPLGLAVTVVPDGGGGVVLHSSDGIGFSRTDLPAAPDGRRQVVNGVTMTADAVKVRLNVYPVDDVVGGPPLEQRLFVGTPR